MTTADILIPVEQPSITFLNMTGDITIAWDKTNEVQVLAMIEQKMKEGYTFFILKPRFLSIFGKKKVAASSIHDVARAGSVLLEDEQAERMMGTAPKDGVKLDDRDVETLVMQGQVELVKAPDSGPSTLQTMGRAQSAHQVLQSQTVAVRRIVGG